MEKRPGLAAVSLGLSLVIFDQNPDLTMKILEEKYTAFVDTLLQGCSCNYFVELDGYGFANKMDCLLNATAIASASSVLLNVLQNGTKPPSHVLAEQTLMAALCGLQRLLSCCKAFQHSLDASTRTRFFRALHGLISSACSLSQVKIPPQSSL